MTNKPYVPHSHDRFFKASMANQQVAREFFEIHLPANLREVIDLDQLELKPGSYIDEARKESISDTLFKTSIQGHTAYLYLTVEHQSRPDRFMPFRMLKYTCNIIDNHLKETGEQTIPLVIPMVVYHGTDRWTYSTDIKDLIDAPQALIDAYFLKPFSLIDLNTITDAALKEQLWFGVTALTLKHIFDSDLIPYLPDIFHLLKQIDEQFHQKNGKSFTETVLLYIFDKGEVGDKDMFIKLIKNELADTVGDKIMTIAEQFRLEGEQKGKQEGKQEGLEEAALKLQKAGFSNQQVAKILELPLEYIEKLGQV
jgi:predicted transposase/invertase (TIGR01784 family)